MIASLTFCEPKLWVEREQTNIWGAWAKEGVEINQNVSSQGRSTLGVVDPKDRIIGDNERIGKKGFVTMRAPFRQTLNACLGALFIGEDQHEYFLSHESDTCTKVAGASHEKSIPNWLVAALQEKHLFFRKRRVQQYVPQVLIKYPRNLPDSFAALLAGSDERIAAVEQYYAELEEEAARLIRMAFPEDFEQGHSPPLL